MLAGLACAFAAGVVGVALEVWLLGLSERAAFERVERQVRAQFDEMVASLQTTATSLAARDDLVDGVTGDRDAARGLFELLRAAVQEQASADLAVTVYGPDAVARAWSGRPSEIPAERILGEAALFVAPGPLGRRLVYVAPVVDRSAGPAASAPPRPVGSVVGERVLSPAQRVGTPAADNFLLPTSIAPVSLRARYEGAGDRPQPYAFLLLAPTGEPLLEAQVSRSDLVQARNEWRRNVLGVVLAMLALTVLLLAGPLLDWRAQARTRAQYLRTAAALAGVVIVARALLWFAIPPDWSGQPLFSPSYAATVPEPLLRSPVDFLLTALSALALVVLAAHAVGQWRLASRRRRRTSNGNARLLGRFALHQAVAATAVTGLLFGYELFLRDTIDGTAVDLLHSSLHPWNVTRLALMFGLLLFHAAIVWAGVLIFFGALARWRVSRSPGSVSLLLASWALPVTVGLGLGRVPALPFLLVVAACMSAASVARRGIAWHRHASQASRFLAIFLALLLPALLMYPSVLHFSDRAKRRLVETQYAEQAANQPRELQARLEQSRKQIDDIPALRAMVSSLGVAPTGVPQTDSAFRVWRQTVLADLRLTSAVELYGADGSLVSRFALNVPEYAATARQWQGSGCDWEVFGVAAPLGSQERQLLHAERGLCDATRAGSDERPPESRPAGAVVVQVMLDYRALPFISSRAPYVELLRAGPVPPAEGTPGWDIELVIYGWGLHPMFTSGRDAWPLDDDLFARIYASRQAFWTRLEKGGVGYDVYFANNRFGIYALGYPALGPFDHLVNIAEIATLIGLAFVVLLVGAAGLNTLARGRPRAGRDLLREIRASFYRKLFLAFVAAAVVPVLALAFVIRAYFATQLRADVEAGAARTAAVAQRVIEESAELQQAGGASVTTLSDDVMVWISQVVDQDVNIFDGPQLVATSERDLFASGLLPTRTPDDVYRAIALQQLPSFVGEDSVGSVRYMVAAAPVRFGGRDAILTVPQALRQQEIEREIDDLDRGIHLGVVLFILLGAGIGLSMAERIADPVKRLTRATRRIARGDFESRVAVKSADELQRLVEAFNRMAAELKEQRAQLERTHRLEAWAEMARQVAHEIKNPLTPVQLSAEHLLRVHADRGEPLAPVLQSCVESILGQVRLLRRISAEFSSFASSPIARPAPTSLEDLVREVLEPYQVGLHDRIAISIDIPPDLPAVSVDRTLVARALTNVIENALHAMPGQGTLAIAATREAGRVQLVISDTGVGLEEDAVARIFEPYFSTKATGTGLGLTIAKRNVELNDGMIEVRSQKGRGTTVILTFPLKTYADR